MVVKGSLDGRVEDIILKMEFGEEMFTLPEALNFMPGGDGKYKVYLNVMYSVTKERMDEDDLFIKRISYERDGFEINLDSVSKNYVWEVCCGKCASDDDSESDDEGHHVLVGYVDMF